MKFSMTGLEKCDLLIHVTALIEVAAWAGLTVLRSLWIVKEHR